MGIDNFHLQITTYSFYFVTDAIILPNSSYTHGTEAIFLSDLNCHGDEAYLLNCNSQFRTPPGLVMSCDHSDDVGVLCPGELL